VTIVCRCAPTTPIGVRNGQALLVDEGARFDLPPEHEAGLYVNAFSIWHSEHEFTIDFAAKIEAQAPGLQEPAQALVVSRVRLPPALAFELIRSINREMADYEDEWGEIHRPRRRGEEHS
jgi:hypothetical protein